MVSALNQRREPFGLIVSGEAGTWLEALERIVGRSFVVPYPVGSESELLNVVESGRADMAVLDEDVDWPVDVLQLLRMIRRMDRTTQVVVVSEHCDRRWLESALRLAAFSVLSKPVQFEALLRQIAGMMQRLDQALREGPDEQ